MDKSSLTVVNPHYLKNVMETAKSHEVIAGEDIYDARGIKLIAKGGRVDEKVRDRLIRFKLLQPLERSLTVKEGVTADGILKKAEDLLDEVKPLSLLFHAKGSAKQALELLKGVNLEQMGTLLVTMENGIGKLPHSVLVTLSGLAFAMALGFPRSQLHELVLACLLHDVGELYVNPEYLNPDRVLMPDEWKHIAVHPHVGQLVISEIPQWPKSISIAVGEHHERANGFGYPRRLTADRLSALGKVLIVSEALCGILTKKNRPIERASVAVRVIAGEYPPEIVSFIASIARSVVASEGDTTQSSVSKDLLSSVERVENTMERALETIGQVVTESSAEASSKAFLREVSRRLLMLKTAVVDAGLSPCYQIERIEDRGITGEISLELETVVHEIQWRLRELSRQVALMGTEKPQEEQKDLERVVACLVVG